MYDFETLVNRREQGSAKWNMMDKENLKVEEDVFPLSVADTDLVLAPEIKEGLQSYLEDMVLGYTIPTDSYYDSVINWYKRRYNYLLEKEWIIPHPGVVSALYNIIGAFTKPLDKVLIMSPVYYPFRNVIVDQKREILETDLLYNNQEYTIDFEDFERKAKEASLFILCSPHNPVGRVWTKEELNKINDICLRNNVLVVSDEIHSDLILPGHTHYVFNSLSKEAQENTILVSAPSKTFNLAGLQASNIMIPNSKLRTQFLNYMSHTPIHGVNVLGMKACEIAYNQAQSWLEAFLELLETNRKLVETYIEKHIPQIKVVPLEGTYLQWLDFTELGLEEEVIETFLTQESQIFLNTGSKFGANGENFMRMNIACPTKKLQEVLNRLKRIQNLT